MEGKWIKTEKIEKVCSIKKDNNEIYSKYDKLATYRCSNCGYKTGKIALEYNYCPKCGIIMKKNIDLSKAIEILKELWRYEKTDKYTNEEIRGALLMGIGALSADYLEELKENNK